MTVQRMSDIVIALVLLLLCLPVLVLVSVILAFEQAHVPIQRSDRVIRGGRLVRLYQLRVTKTTPFGLRLTAGGAVARRLHLDHIPMLVNVLMGELTLIGRGHGSIASPSVLAERPFS